MSFPSLLPVVNPATTEIIANVANIDENGAKMAIDAAYNALKPWQKHRQNIAPRAKIA